MKWIMTPWTYSIISSVYSCRICISIRNRMRPIWQKKIDQDPICQLRSIIFHILCRNLLFFFKEMTRIRGAPAVRAPNQCLQLRPHRHKGMPLNDIIVPGDMRTQIFSWVKFFIVVKINLIATHLVKFTRSVFDPTE